MHNLATHSRFFAELRQLLPDVRRTTLNNLALMVLALQSSKSIHLGQIGAHLPGVTSKNASLANRMHRFVCNKRVGVSTHYAPVARLLLGRMAQGKGSTLQGPCRVLLVMDVTQAGRFQRMLTISVVCRKRTLPLAWCVCVGTKGGIGVTAQTALLAQVQAWLPAECQPMLLTDAGFESLELVRWLQAQQWAMVLRRPGLHVVGHAASAETVCTEAPLTWQRIDAFPLRQGETRVLPNVYWGEPRRGQSRQDPACLGPFTLVLHWQAGEANPWYLLTTESSAQSAMRLYRKRMQVEEMYADFKRLGFMLQASHLRHPDRLERLMLVVALCYVWCMALGSWLVKNSKRTLVDVKSRRDHSYFRIGYDWLTYCLRIGAVPLVRLVPYP